LVGTASGDLSAEIVVGTTPGGELGGTWASPTVDATHSGSTHDAATNTHIADGTDAHDASAISFSPVGSIAATDVQAAIAEVASEAGGSYTLTVEDEGTPLATGATTLDFVGAGVTATGAGAEKTITIPGGGSGVTVQDEGTPLATDGTTLNFVGAGVTATGAGATKTITIPGGGGATTAVVLGLPTGTHQRTYTFDSTVESWTTDAGTLSSTGSKLRLVHTSAAIAVEPSGASNVADGEAQWDFNTTAMTGSAGLIFRYVDANNFYMVTFQPGAALQMFKRVAGSFSSFGATANNPNFARAVIPVIRVMARFVGANLEVYVNGTLVLWENDTAHSTGRVGIRADNATMEVDNVKVYSNPDYNTTNL
jgi:hypothetical protein